MEETNMKHRLLQPWNAEQWLSSFGKAESDTHMLHALRKQVYEYTVQAAMQGSYEIIKTDPETKEKQIKTVRLALDPDIAKNSPQYKNVMRKRSTKFCLRTAWPLPKLLWKKMREKSQC